MGAIRRLVEQARKMEQAARNASIVVDYRGGGYSAVKSEAVIQAEGVRDAVAHGEQGLGEMLADQFLECEVGRRDMYFDAARGRLIQARPGGLVALRFVIGTRVRTVVDGVRGEVPESDAE